MRWIFFILLVFLFPIEAAAQRAFPRLAPTFDHIDCDATLGCNKVDGYVLIDRARYFGGVSGNRDTDGDPGFAGDPDADGGARSNAASDYINTGKAAPDGVGERDVVLTTTGTAAANAVSFSLTSSAAAVDNLFCRCRGGGGDPDVCSVDADCSGGDTCDDVMSADSLTKQRREMAIQIPNCNGSDPCFEKVAYGIYGGCDAAGVNVSIDPGLRRAVPAGSTVQMYKYDELHHTTTSARYEAFAIWKAPVEMHFVPKKNLLVNGYGEDSTNNWTYGETTPAQADGTIASVAYDPDLETAESDTGDGSAYRGSSLKLTAGLSNTDSWAESDEITVVPGVVYTLDAQIRAETISGNGASMEVVDATDSDAQVTLTRVWNCLGECLSYADADGTKTGHQLTNALTGSWIPIVAEFTAPSTTIKIRFRMQNATGLGVIEWDEVELHRSVDQDATALQMIFGTFTPKTLRLGCTGDSRSDEKEGHPAAASSDDLCAALDATVGWARPDLTLVQSVYDNSTVARGGRPGIRFLRGTSEGSNGANHDDNEPSGVKSFVEPDLDPCLLGTGSGGDCNLRRFDAVIVEFAHNDLLGIDPSYPLQASPEQMVATIAAICGEFQANGIRCIAYTETQFRGNGADDNCSDDGVAADSDNCGEVIQRYNALLMRGNGLGTIGGIGW